MGITPHKKGITIGFDCQFEVQLKDSGLSTPIFTGSISVIIRPELCSPNNFNGHII